MKQVLQFKITLLDTKPEIWRRIQIAETATFWDLHVALQNVMGWEDCHVHMFTVFNCDKTTKDAHWRPIADIGVPHEFNPDVLPDWDIKVADYLDSDSKILYEYDFGDSWIHQIEFEGYFERITGQRYPQCLDGAMSCPPEDIGGIGGYYNFVEIMSNKKHPEYRDMFGWYGKTFDASKFDKNKVKFQNAKIRLKNLSASM